MLESQYTRQKVETQSGTVSLNMKTEGITSILWCTGFKPDYSWLKIDCLDIRGRPIHKRGITPEHGVYFLGMNWLNTWGSGRILSVADDAEFLVEDIKNKLSITDSSKNIAVSL